MWSTQRQRLRVCLSSARRARVVVRERRRSLGIWRVMEARRSWPCQRLQVPVPPLIGQRRIHSV